MKKMKTFRKTEIARALASDPRLGLDRRRAALVLEAALHIVARELLRGGAVRLTPIGVLSVRHRAVRVMKLPRTGEPRTVPAHRAAHFKPSRRLALLLRALTPPEGAPGGATA